ncbi:MAG: glutamine--fructose-6-phosphate transaminase (isomerizing) [Bacteroidetes bacterium]|jgi:glucosamine--fructose-6-phosphate aminotransferase (isomerizing)|nr:glutamine--fructose-6-phosphate transaminase (isomerizing) [Bacteroidota bacterium]
MCGIVAYLGNKNAAPVLIKGLKRLEYRGYDSAGIAVWNNGLKISKKAGKVVDLELQLTEDQLSGTVGIGHTRWATHGAPNDRNAHPHLSGNSKLAIIHNGIIENHATVKEALIRRGHRFVSDTDTEVLIHLVEEIQDNEQCPLHDAVRLALQQVTGAYAIVVISEDQPGEMIAARKGSPLVMGIGSGEFFLASDATPIAEYTKNVVYLNDGQMVRVDLDGYQILNIADNSAYTPTIHQLEISLEQLEKGGYDHFMLKEIHEQPRAIYDTLRGRLLPEEGIIRMAGLEDNLAKFINAQRIIIIACGTSWHAGLVAEYLIEDLARLPVEVEYASEFRYRNPIIRETDIVIPISQSGETADTLAAVEMAKAKGAFVFGICNVPASSIPRATHAGAYTHAGPEIGVASTKAFTTQIAILTLIATYLGYKRGTITASRYQEILFTLHHAPAKVEEALKLEKAIQEVALQYQGATNFLYLGRGVNFPIGLEGALKLKEISYIHAEGYPAAEMKHGPIALIDENMPVVVIATSHQHYDKILSNIQEVKARKGKVIAIIDKFESEIKSLADHIIEVPDADAILAPLVNVIPLQFLAYHIAVMRGCNVDQPRNLAKSVTVE